MTHLIAGKYDLGRKQKNMRRVGTWTAKQRNRTVVLRVCLKIRRMSPNISHWNPRSATNKLCLFKQAFPGCMLSSKRSTMRCFSSRKLPRNWGLPVEVGCKRPGARDAETPRVLKAWRCAFSIPEYLSPHSSDWPLFRNMARMKPTFVWTILLAFTNFTLLTRRCH